MPSAWLLLTEKEKRARTKVVEENGVSEHAPLEPHCAGAVTFGSLNASASTDVLGPRARTGEAVQQRHSLPQPFTKEDLRSELEIFAKRSEMYLRKTLVKYFGEARAKPLDLTVATADGELDRHEIESHSDASLESLTPVPAPPKGPSTPMNGALMSERPSHISSRGSWPVPTSSRDDAADDLKFLARPANFALTDELIRKPSRRGEKEIDSLREERRKHAVDRKVSSTASQERLESFRPDRLKHANSKWAMHENSNGHEAKTQQEKGAEDEDSIHWLLRKPMKTYIEADETIPARAQKKNLMDRAGTVALQMPEQKVSKAIHEGGHLVPEKHFEMDQARSTESVVTSSTVTDSPTLPENPGGGKSKQPESTRQRDMRMKKEELRKMRNTGCSNSITGLGSLDSSGAFLDDTSKRFGWLYELEDRAWELSATCVCHPYFDYGSAFLIVLNSIAVGMQTDYVAHHLGQDLPGYFRIFDVIFCILFTLELVFRVFVHRQHFYRQGDWKWNIFDTLLVGMQLAEEFITVIITATGEQEEEESVGFNFSFMRVLRILRLVRIIRLFRVLRVIGELRTIVASIAGCMRPLLSALLLLMLMIYVVGVFFTQAVSFHFEDQDVDERDDMLASAFGTLSQSIFSLYQAILGGVDWGDVANPIVDNMSVIYGFVFVLYIAFACLAMMNVMTGVFVEAALGIAKKDEDIYMVNHMKNLLQITDVDESGEISLDEFESQLGNPHMLEYFKCIDVDVSEGRTLFNILDPDDTGIIPAEQFVSGCLRLRGPARALDLEILTNFSRKASLKSIALMRHIESLAEELILLLADSSSAARASRSYSKQGYARKQLSSASNACDALRATSKERHLLTPPEVPHQIPIELDDGLGYKLPGDMPEESRDSARDVRVVNVDHDTDEDQHKTLELASRNNSAFGSEREGCLQSDDTERTAVPGDVSRNLLH